MPFFLLITVTASVLDGSADTVDTALLSRVAFGSCSKQHKVQPLWPHVAALQPQLWVWGGDAVYPRRSDGADRYASTSLDALRAAYTAMNASAPYVRMKGGLRAAAAVIGTYDDHDYGVNDAGGGGGLMAHGVVDRAQRAVLFHDFLGVAEAAPRRRRDGVYASHVYGPKGRRVKVIALDTRFNREPHVLPSVGALLSGSLMGKLTPVLAATSRWLSTWLGWTEQHIGAVLGEPQWLWLERELAESSAAVHVVVSSVQVLTTNPMVESWGHFPAERRRLLALLRKHAPRGLVLLSGDVHVAELAVARPRNGGGNPAGAGGSAEELAIARDTVIEVTSSGLTHSCMDGGIPGFVCRAVWRRFAAHRLAPSGATLGARPSQHFIGKNFGVLDIEWRPLGSAAGGGAPAFNVTVYDAAGRAALRVRRAARGAERPALASLLPRDVTPLDAALGVSGAFVATLLGALCVGALGAAWWVSQQKRRRWSRRGEQHSPEALAGGAALDGGAARAAAKAQPNAMRYFDRAAGPFFISFVYSFFCLLIYSFVCSILLFAKATRSATLTTTSSGRIAPPRGTRRARAPRRR